jgi:serine protease Do
MFASTTWAQPAQRGQDGKADNEVSQQQAVAAAESVSTAFRLVAKRVKPAVVQISATVVENATKEERKPRRPNIDPKQIPEPWRQFFEDFGENMPQEPQPQYGRGSGVIVDAEKGYILTNNHVVGGGGKKERERVRLDVTLDNGRQVHATILGQDPKTDIALVKVNDRELQDLRQEGVKLAVIPIGDSSKMDVGDWVLAIGAPFGLAQTVTSGIISATGRNNVGIAGIEDFIQTDAAINPGNSGGPLVNLRGELIGINTAIATSGLTRGYMGIGFAIPTEIIRQILGDLEAGRDIVRGYLGVQIRGLEQSPGLAKTFGLKQDRGVLVEDVRPDTPASKAGRKAEDIILSVGNTKVESVSQLQGVVARTKPGHSLDLTVWRDNKEITIPVKIEAQPEDFYASRNWSKGGKGSPEGEEEGDESKIESVGMSVAMATPELAKKLNLDYDDVKGQILVTQVDSLGEAGALRISAGDVIVSVQGAPVKSVGALRKALSPEALQKGVRLRVRGEAGPRTLLLQVSP